MYPIDAEKLAEIRQQLRRELDGYPSGCCMTSSYAVRSVTGAEISFGLFVDDRNLGKNHHWNTAPDGTIIDLTASQFGDFPEVFIVRPDSPVRSRYVEGVYLML